jgi:hypothetical protein
VASARVLDAGDWPSTFTGMSVFGTAIGAMSVAAAVVAFAASITRNLNKILMAFFNIREVIGFKKKPIASSFVF